MASISAPAELPINIQPELSAPSEQPGSFFETHKEQLEEYFTLVKNAPKWSDDLGTFVENTQKTLAGDHSAAGWKPEVPPEGEDRVKDIYRELGLIDEITPAPGNYDYILVFGAVQVGSNSRLALFKEMWGRGVTADQIVLFGGPRKPFSVEAEDIAEDLEIAKSRDEQSPWMKSVLHDQNPDARIESEREGMRLAMERQLGPLVLKRIGLRLENERLLGNHEFSFHDKPLTLFDATTVRRPQGDARPTTASCVAEFLEEFEPDEDAQVLCYVAQPHAERMRKTITRILNGHKRRDIDVVIGASAGQKNLGHTHYWREIVANAYEDQQAIQ